MRDKSKYTESQDADQSAGAGLVPPSGKGYSGNTTKGPSRAQRRRAEHLSRTMYKGLLALPTSSRELESVLLELQMAPDAHKVRLGYQAYKQGLITAEAARLLGCSVTGSGKKGYNHA